MTTPATPNDTPVSVRQLHAVLDAGAADRIAAAVHAAEANTSAEIMVRLAAVSPAGEPRIIAEAEFMRLGLAGLAFNNGVLIYVALDRRAVEVVVGDEAARSIDVDVWKQAADTIAAGFRDHRAAEGIIAAVEGITAPLVQAFPCNDSSAVDLPNVMEDS